MPYYKVTMTYPGGRVEEVEDTFSTLEKAKDFGQQLILQAQANSRQRDTGAFFKKKTKAFFVVYEKEGKESNLVFDSRQ